MARVIKGTRDLKRQRKQIAVKSTGHPAAFRKVRCPKGCTGYAVESNVEAGAYQCERCGSTFKHQAL